MLCYDRGEPPFLISINTNNDTKLRPEDAATIARQSVDTQMDTMLYGKTVPRPTFFREPDKLAIVPGRMLESIHPSLHSMLRIAAS